MWTTWISKISRVPGSKSWESLTHPVHMYTRWSGRVGGGRGSGGCGGRGGSCSQSIWEGGHNGSQTNCASSKRIKAKVAITSNRERFVQKRRSDGKCWQSVGRPRQQAGVALVWMSAVICSSHSIFLWPCDFYLTWGDDLMTSWYEEL